MVGTKENEKSCSVKAKKQIYMNQRIFLTAKRVKTPGKEQLVQVQVKIG